MFTERRIKIFDVSFFVYFVLLPLVFFPFLIDPFLLSRQLLTNVFLFCIICFFLKFNKSKDFISVDSATVFYLIFIIFSAFSFFNAQIVDISHLVFSKYLTFFVFFVLLKVLLAKDLLEEKTLLKSVLYFGLISIAITVLAFINKSMNGQTLFRQVDMMSGTFGNKNFLSSILFICVPFYFIGLSLSKKMRWLSIIAILTTISLLIFLRTRTVLIALSLFLFLVFLNYIKQTKILKSKKKLISIVIVSFLGLLFFGIFKMKILNYQYFKRLFASATFYSRLEFWNQALLIIKDNFFGGIGIGNWIDVYPKYGLNNFTNPDIQNGRLIINNTHNDFLQVFLEIGFFGFISYLGIFIITIYQACWLLKNEKNETEKKQVAYLLFSILSYFIIAFFDFPLTRIEHQIILLIIFVLIQTKYLFLKKRYCFNLPTNYLVFICSILLIYSTTIVIYRIKGEIHLFKAFNAEKRGDYYACLEELKLSKTIFFKTDNFALPIEWHKGKINFRMLNFEASLENYKSAYHTNPYSVVVNNDLASAFIKNSDTSSALHYYKNALKFSPNYFDAQLNLAVTYFNLKQFEKAFETIDQCRFENSTAQYEHILIPIVEKKLNLELEKLKNQKLNSFLTARIKTQEDLKALYFDYKKSHITFTNYLISLKN